MVLKYPATQKLALGREKKVQRSQGRKELATFEICLGSETLITKEERSREYGRRVVRTLAVSRKPCL